MPSRSTAAPTSTTDSRTARSIACVPARPPRLVQYSREPLNWAITAPPLRPEAP